jgi:hypothetical protein
VRHQLTARPERLCVRLHRTCNSNCQSRVGHRSTLNIDVHAWKATWHECQPHSIRSTQVSCASARSQPRYVRVILQRKRKKNNNTDCSCLVCTVLRSVPPACKPAFNIDHAPVTLLCRTTHVRQASSHQFEDHNATHASNISLQELCSTIYDIAFLLCLFSSSAQLCGIDP